MSKEWAHIAAWKEVPTVNNFGGYAVATDTRAYLAVAGACPRGGLLAQLVQDSSGPVAARTAMRSEVVVARPRMQLQKYPFTTHGAGINGAKSGPHRAWDPV
ncbi:MAG: hypothetical protein J2P30_16355 [Actinobacteria bacterium]|nr:hypothetical protein [Actinomycetota bacterium]